MTFETYENTWRRYVRIHRVGCVRSRVHGGTHKYGQGGYRQYATYEAARSYAESTGLAPLCCKTCRPCGSPWGTS